MDPLDTQTFERGFGILLAALSVNRLSTNPEATGAEACVATATLPQGAMRMSIFDYMRAALRPEVASSIFLFAVRCPCFGSLLRPLQVFLVGLIANAAAGGLVRGAKGTGHGGGN